MNIPPLPYERMTMDSRFLLHYLQSLFESGVWTPERKEEMEETIDEVRITRYRKSIERYVRYLSSRPYQKNEAIDEKQKEPIMKYEAAKHRAGDVQKIRILVDRVIREQATLFLLERDGDVWTRRTVTVPWEERRRYYDVAWTSCEACIEDQPNQQAHMEFGGCLEETE